MMEDEVRKRIRGQILGQGEINDDSKLEALATRRMYRLSIVMRKTQASAEMEKLSEEQVEWWCISLSSAGHVNCETLDMQVWGSGERFELGTYEFGTHQYIDDS